jgi:hypothetical protein
VYGCVTRREAAEAHGGIPEDRRSSPTRALEGRRRSIGPRGSRDPTRGPKAVVMARRTLADARRSFDEMLPGLSDYWAGIYRKLLTGYEGTAQQAADEHVSTREQEALALRKDALRELAAARDAYEDVTREALTGRTPATDLGNPACRGPCLAGGCGGASRPRGRDRGADRGCRGGPRRLVQRSAGAASQHAE